MRISRFFGIFGILLRFFRKTVPIFFMCKLFRLHDWEITSQTGWNSVACWPTSNGYKNNHIYRITLEYGCKRCYMNKSKFFDDVPYRVYKKALKEL